MALSIYETPNADTSFSSGTNTNPISFTVDGTLGATITKKIYLRNDSASHYYTNIQITPSYNLGEDIVTGSLSTFHWKLIAGDSQPLEDQWQLVSGGNTMTLPNLGSAGNATTTTYLPFWLRVNVPKGIDIQVFEHVTLEVTATENNA